MANPSFKDVSLEEHKGVITMTLRVGKTSSFPLRLPVTMRRELKALAESEGISINQLISLAVAEKIVRCQRQGGLVHTDGLKSPTQDEFNMGPSLDTYPLVLGSLKADSARHPNLVPSPICSLAHETGDSGGVPTDGSKSEQHSGFPDSQAAKSNGAGFVI